MAQYTKHEFAERGDAIYEKQIRPHLTEADFGKFIAIDIESGAYVMRDHELAAFDALMAEVPSAQIWLRRAGSRFARHFAPRYRSI